MKTIGKVAKVVAKLCLKVMDGGGGVDCATLRGSPLVNLTDIFRCKLKSKAFILSKKQRGFCET